MKGCYQELRLLEEDIRKERELNKQLNERKMSEHTNYRSSENSYVKILDKNEKIRCLVKNSRTYV